MTRIYVRSGTSPVALEEAPLAPSPEFHQDMRIEVVDDYSVTYFPQERRLSLRPSVEGQQ